MADFVVTALFILFGYLILKLGRRLEARSHLPVIRYAGGRWLGTEDGRKENLSGEKPPGDKS